MTPADLLARWKTQLAVAVALGVSQAAVAQWVQAGKVPMRRQFQVQILTRGKLRADV